MGERTPPVYRTGERRYENPSRLNLVVLRDGVDEGIEGSPFPVVPLAISNSLDRLLCVERDQPRKAGEFGGMFANAFFDDEIGQIFSVKIFARCPRRLRDDGLVLEAESLARSYHQALTTIVNAVAAGEEFVHHFNRVK